MYVFQGKNTKKIHGPNSAPTYIHRIT